MSVKTRACGLCCTKVKDLQVTIENRVILKDINLHFHCGQLTLLIGRNGSGKTTLLRALLGELPHTGNFHFLDHKGQHTDKPLIGYVPQKFQFDRSMPVTVEDLFNISHPALRNQNSIKEILIEVEADHLLKCKLGSLSGGELQRILLALSMIPLPDLLLLDEPLNGIDYNGLELFYKMVSRIRKQYDLAIIMVAHDLDTIARYADRLVLIDQQTIACQGKPATVYKNAAFRRIFPKLK
jgi:zinc transport system ATP-binding protein